MIVLVHPGTNAPLRSWKPRRKRQANRSRRHLRPLWRDREQKEDEKREDGASERSARLRPQKFSLGQPRQGLLTISAELGMASGFEASFISLLDVLAPSVRARCIASDAELNLALNHDAPLNALLGKERALMLGHKVNISILLSSRPIRPCLFKA